MGEMVLAGVVLGLVVGVALLVGYWVGDRNGERRLTGHPDDQGACGPHCVKGEFYYLVPEATWEDARVAMLLHEREVASSRLAIEKGSCSRCFGRRWGTGQRPTWALNREGGTTMADRVDEKTGVQITHGFVRVPAGAGKLLVYSMAMISSGDEPTFVALPVIVESLDGPGAPNPATVLAVCARVLAKAHGEATEKPA